MKSTYLAKKRRNWRERIWIKKKWNWKEFRFGEYLVFVVPFSFILTCFFSSSHFLWSDSLVQFAVYAFIWSHEIVGRTTNFTGQNNILRNVIVSKLHFYSHHELTNSENDFRVIDWTIQKTVFHMESFKHQSVHRLFYAETAKFNVNYSPSECMSINLLTTEMLNIKMSEAQWLRWY